MKYTEEKEADIPKEISRKNKIIEKNFKIGPILDKATNEEKNIIKKLDWKLLKDYSYHYEQNIDRIWEIINSLMNNSQSDLIIINNVPDFLKPGNNLEGKILKIFEFKAKVIKLKKFSEKKILELMFYIKNREDFKIKIILYKVTEDNSTILYLKIKYDSSKKENIIFKIQEKYSGITFFKNIEQIIKKESIYLSQYESGIILGTLEEIWDILTDNTKLVLVAPNNDCFVPININIAKIGEICLINLRIKNIDGYLEIKLDSKENKPNWNEWSFSYSIIGGEPFRIAKQTVFVQLIKINKDETQLNVLTIIYQKITKQMLKNLSEKKKYVIFSIKDYFENFSTPKNLLND